MNFEVELKVLHKWMEDEAIVSKNVQNKKDKLIDYLQATYMEFKESIDAKVLNYLKKEFNDTPPLNYETFAKEFSIGFPHFIFSEKDSAVRLRYVEQENLKSVVRKKPTIQYLDKIKPELGLFAKKAGIEKLIVHSLGNTRIINPYKE
ncbi:MAG: hypothetical protein ABIB43_03590 [archaeon]